MKSIKHKNQNRKCRKNFSTSQKYSIKKSFVKNIIEDIKAYDNTKLSFKNPGYPSFADLANQCRNKEQFEERLERFKNKHSIQAQLERHHEEVTNKLLLKYAESHPGVSSQVLREVIKKEQSKLDYYGPKGSEDYPFVNKEEARWCEKLDDRAFKHGGDLPNSPVSYDSALDAAPGTPSVRSSPYPPGGSGT